MKLQAGGGLAGGDDHGRTAAPAVVHDGDAVGHAHADVEVHEGRALGDAGVTIGHAGGYPFE